jgi:alpha-mannosidase
MKSVSFEHRVICGFNAGLPQGEQARGKREMKFINRRQFLTAISATAGWFMSKQGMTQSAVAVQREVFLVPNFHPASCGWLTTFSRERVYCANSYLDHLDRVRDDPQYAFVMSEINNIIAIMNFQPQRIPELKQRIAEKRVELVNGFFLESTINLSGGEALVRLGVEGLRWYKDVFDMSPKYAWTIDVCGTHDQMAQIASGLGLQAMVYTRGNPTGKTIYWSESPDGSRILTQTPLNTEQLNGLEKLFEERQSTTPEGAPVLVLAGSGDYSTAPVLKSYPGELLKQWKQAGLAREIKFATLSEYVEPVAAKIRSGEIQIPTFKGGTAYAFDAFWIENNEVKTRYRKSEQTLQSAEMLATIASLSGVHEYPVDALHSAWTLMFLNMDRNTLWGSAGGMVFVSDQSWDVQDRFNWVDTTTAKSIAIAAKAIFPKGRDAGLFNPLNWRRNDPTQMQLPQGKTLEGVKSELLPDGSVLCQIEMPAVATRGCKLVPHPAKPARTVNLPETIETAFYSIRIDRSTGALTSLKLNNSGRELLGGPANEIAAERPVKKEDAPADFMAPQPGRVQLASSNEGSTAVECSNGPVAYTVVIKGTFYGGGAIERRVRIYHDYPRIDFDTELNDIPNYTVVVSKFPLATDIAEVRRGIPYGFSHGAWAKPNPAQHGWTKGIVPAVRWTDYALSDGAGFAIFDRGLSGRELNERTARIFLLNAEDEYHGFPNPWLTGKGKHLYSYSILPHEKAWEHARIPQMAWEYSQAPILVAGCAVTPAHSFLETSDNIIVEAMRRNGDHVELRFVECLGLSGNAIVKISLSHGQAILTNLAGEKESALPSGSVYTIPVRAQQIVTMRLQTSTSLPVSKPVLAWDPFVPKQKLPALHRYDPNLKGHPPFGDGTDF